jgi:hypothetical protein
VKVGVIYRPRAFEHKDDLFVHIFANHRMFGHFCRTFGALFYPTFLGQIERLVVLG